MHILTNISRSTGNQTMKFGQLIEYNMRKHFSSKIIHKMQWRYYSQPLYTVCFLFLCKVESYQNILKESCCQLLLPHIKLLLKYKNRSGTSLPILFSAWFLKKNSFLVTFSHLTKFHCLFVFTLWDIGQYEHCCCLLNFDIINMTKKSTVKFKYLQNEKSF